MRYNPATENARYSIDEIAEQCRNAIIKAKRESAIEQLKVALDSTDFCNIRWENDILIPA
jgi:hypothetical protein